MKPFKPLTISSRPPLSTLSNDDLSQRPLKRQRLDPPTAKPQSDQWRAINNQKLAVETVQKDVLPSQLSDKIWYNVLWRKFTTKKNKIWDGDGVLIVQDGHAILQDTSGRALCRGSCKSSLDIGSELSLSGREIVIESVITKEEAISGQRFLAVKKPAIPKRSLSAILSNTKQEFKSPLLQNSVLVPKNDKTPTPRHDPTAEGALVMPKTKNIPRGRQVVDVVVDPLLTKHLREHQRAGVSFLYECVMGMKDCGGEGAILADEMGLGKTLQTIALLWTLLKQNPTYDDPPVVKKALIVCPVTLINNWRKEFRKWLGKERLGVFVAGEKDTRITDFTLGKAYSVMIIGYERLRNVKDDLLKGHGIDIVIADEGHRLKTAKNKSADAIKQLPTERRIILSGTPLQNDLEEFYTMVDFVNPGLLNKYSVFKRQFEVPITKSHQPGASKDDMEKGEARNKELVEITEKFVLRRTAEILSKYLPTKTEYVLFCKPTNAQAAIYKAILQSPIYASALNSSGVQLELINVLKQVCNSPKLLLREGKNGEESTRKALFEHVSQAQLKAAASSGKLQVLDSLLHRIRTTTEEKVVLVSNYTSTLDILANLLTSLHYGYLRLDGNVAASKRQDLVDRFNRSSANNFFVFLLSAKAGGVGLNLIGASRLVLYDLDWNPAVDLQAMARIHRDGQKKPCFIYRLLTQGALDEKIFQRQASKTGLSASIVDGKSGTSGFSKAELRDIFSFDDTPGCQTHRLLGCECGGTGLPLIEPEEEAQARNDLAAPSSNSIETIHLEDEPDWKPTSSFTSSAKVDMEAQEKEIARKAHESRDSSGRLKLSSLMQYQHLDSSPQAVANKSPAYVAIDDSSSVGSPDDEEKQEITADKFEGVIDDVVLRTVLEEDGGRVGFVFSKISS